jgi:membrane-associated phospholipid phosphatase
VCKLLPSIILAITLALPSAAFAGETERDFAQQVSDEGTVVFLVAGIGLPLLEESEAGEQQAYRTLDALIATTIATEGLQRIIQTERPDGSGEEDSFPSLHSSAAFSVATLQAERHPDEAWLWYSGAALIATSRLPLKRHRVSEVLAGAALGFGIAQWELSAPQGLLLQPLINPQSGDLGLFISKRF